MFAQVAPEIIDTVELAHGGVRMRCQVSCVKTTLQGLDTVHTSDLKFRLEGVSVVATVPACRSVRNLRFTISAPCVLDFYVRCPSALPFSSAPFASYHSGTCATSASASQSSTPVQPGSLSSSSGVCVKQKLAPGVTNIVVPAPFGSEGWLVLEFGRPEIARRGNLYPDLESASSPAMYEHPFAGSIASFAPSAPPLPVSEEEAGAMIVTAQRKIQEASVAKTLEGGVGESEVKRFKETGQFYPMSYDYAASWCFPLKLVRDGEQPPATTRQEAPLRLF